MPPRGPLRLLCIGSFVTNLGNGAWYASWAVFLTTSVGLSAAAVGIGMTLAGVLGTVLATPAGHLADRVGPREVVVTLLVTDAIAFAGYALVGGLAAFLAVATVSGACATAAVSARRALVAGLTPPAQRSAALAALRVANHAGTALGAAGGALVLALGAREAYLALIVVNSATTLVSAALTARVPKVPGVPPAPGPGLEALRDRAYVTLAALMGVLTLCWGMLSSGVPLWIARHTDAPVAIAGAIVVLNALGIVGLQTRAARIAATPRHAARVALWAGTALAASCLAFAAAGTVAGALVAAAVLLAAGCLHLAGELLYVAASWGLSLPLMDPERPGQYQGVFATGESAATTLAPAAMTLLIADWGAPGWVVLAALFAAAGAATGPATRWALRTRPAYRSIEDMSG